MVDFGQLSFFDQDFDHIKSPWEIAVFEQLEPCIGASLDELLFRFVDGVEWADFGIAAAGFYFDKKQKAVLAGDDVDFATARSFEISFQDPVTTGAEEIDCDAFAVFADPASVSGDAIGISQAARRVEPPAETSDDGSDKGRVSEALQDATWCHNLGVSQSRIAETRGRFPA